MATLSLKTHKSKTVRHVIVPDEAPDHPGTRYLLRDESVFMVWREGGDMPKRVYRPDEAWRAIEHAKKLARETGDRFYVLRSWRGFDPVQEG